MDFPVKHLSYSAIMEYLRCKYMFYKKYIRLEYDEKTWMGTVIGNGLHYCAESWFTNKLTKWDQVKKTYIMEQVHKFNKGELLLHDKDVPDEATFTKKLQEGLDTVLPLLDAYIKQKGLQEVSGAEVTLKVDLAGEGALPLKAKIDLITKNNEIIDWKCVKSLSKGETLAYTLQATAYALAFEAHRGHLPTSVTFVEFLRTGGPSEGQNLAKYEERMAAWKEGGEEGPKPRRPRQSKGQPEKARMQEIIVPITEWKIEAFLLLYGLICDELAGKNLLLEGTPLPSLVSKYEPIPEGWIEFCKQHLGFDPYSGKLSEDNKIKVQNTRELLDATKDIEHKGGVAIIPFTEYKHLKLPPIGLIRGKKEEKSLRKIDKPVYTISVDDLPF